jgi:hypothetical protein
LSDADQLALERLADDMLREMALKGPVPLPVASDDQTDIDVE